MTVKEFLIKHGRCNTSYLGLTQLFPSVVCKDGATLSVQASSMHHCYPEETLEGNEITNYETVEVYTDIVDSRLDRHHMYEHCYGDVDFDTLDSIIQNHGGILEEQTV